MQINRFVKKNSGINIYRDLKKKKNFIFKLSKYIKILQSSTSAKITRLAAFETVVWYTLKISAILPYCSGSLGIVFLTDYFCEVEGLLVQRT